MSQQHQRDARDRQEYTDSPFYKQVTFLVCLPLTGRYSNIAARHFAAVQVPLGHQNNETARQVHALYSVRRPRCKAHKPVKISFPSRVQSRMHFPRCRHQLRPKDSNRGLQLQLRAFELLPHRPGMYCSVPFIVTNVSVNGRTTCLGHNIHMFNQLPDPVAGEESLCDFARRTVSQPRDTDPSEAASRVTPLY
jgi:hypothetical protein